MCLPLGFALLTPEHQARAEMLFVFGDYPYPGASNEFSGKLWRFIQNMGAHLSPSYLFFKGDGNLRHSPPFSGMLSLFSMGVISIYFVSLLLKVQKFANKKIWIYCGWGIFCFTIGAAITWEGIPHAIRSIGAWPLWVLLIAFMYESIKPRVGFIILYLGVLVQMGMWQIAYYDSNRHTNIWFDQAMTDMADNNPDLLKQQKYNQFAKFYHLVRTGNMSEDDIKKECLSK
jgi:hypothetical protein